MLRHMKYREMCEVLFVFTNLDSYEGHAWNNILLKKQEIRWCFETPNKIFYSSKKYLI